MLRKPTDLAVPRSWGAVEGHSRHDVRNCYFFRPAFFFGVLVFFAFAAPDFADVFLAGFLVLLAFGAAFLADFFVKALLTVSFVAAVNDFMDLDSAISFEFAPAIPPTTAPTAAPTGPSSAPAAAPAAAPPAILRRDVSPDFVPVLFTFAMRFVLAVSSP